MPFELAVPSRAASGEPSSGAWAVLFVCQDERSSKVAPFQDSSSWHTSSIWRKLGVMLEVAVGIVFHERSSCRCEKSEGERRIHSVASLAFLLV